MTIFWNIRSDEWMSLANDKARSIQKYFESYRIILFCSVFSNKRLWERELPKKMRFDAHA